jgi:hypothetical protein
LTHLASRGKACRRRRRQRRRRDFPTGQTRVKSQAA